MKRLLYTGSFDPVTFGHIDIIKRASALCDELYVGVGVNANKHPLFAIEERMRLLEEVAASMTNVKVIRVEGLTVDAATALNATLVRGIRNAEDLCREQQIDAINKTLHENIDTIYLMAGVYGHISSSAVKELWKLGAPWITLTKYVPNNVALALGTKSKTW